MTQKYCIFSLGGNKILLFEYIYFLKIPCRCCNTIQRKVNSSFRQTFFIILLIFGLFVCLFEAEALPRIIFSFPPVSRRSHSQYPLNMEAFGRKIEGVKDDVGEGDDHDQNILRWRQYYERTEYGTGCSGKWCFFSHPSPTYRCKRLPK